MPTIITAFTQWSSFAWCWVVGVTFWRFLAGKCLSDADTILDRGPVTSRPLESLATMPNA